jgi:PAS domain S-box-containing protein
MQTEERQPEHFETAREAEQALHTLAGTLSPDLLAGAIGSIRNSEFATSTTSKRGHPMAEARYRTLVELLPAITFMAVFEEGLSEVYVSPQIEMLLGYTQSQWLENPVLWYERLHPGDRERWNVEFARTVAMGEPLRSTYRFLARDGHVVWIHGEARIVRDEHGVPAFIHGMGFDVTKMKEAEQRVVEVADRLKKTNRELEQFAYVASHDLQEPLRTIINFSEILAADYADKLDGVAASYLQRVSQAGQRMKALIQGLLEFSRVGHGEESLDPVPLEKVVKDTLANLDAAIQSSQAEVTWDVLPTLRVNRTHMGLLFQNLIGNAIKFRGTEVPRVRISAERGGDFWLFSVSDNGIGIAPKFHEKVFAIFQRLHTRQQYPGTGIGLSVCKKIVDLHGGRMWVESDLGQGSTFKFTLPDGKYPSK